MKTIMFTFNLHARQAHVKIVQGEGFAVNLATVMLSTLQVFMFLLFYF